jgi:hypothetical protein
MSLQSLDCLPLKVSELFALCEITASPIVMLVHVGDLIKLCKFVHVITITAFTECFKSVYLIILNALMVMPKIQN